MFKEAGGVYIKTNRVVNVVLKDTGGELGRIGRSEPPIMFQWAEDDEVRALAERAATVVSLAKMLEEFFNDCYSGNCCPLASGRISSPLAMDLAYSPCGAEEDQQRDAATDLPN